MSKQGNPNNNFDFANVCSSCHKSLFVTEISAKNAVPELCLNCMLIYIHTSAAGEDQKIMLPAFDDKTGSITTSKNRQETYLKDMDFICDFNEKLIDIKEFLNKKGMQSGMSWVIYHFIYVVYYVLKYFTDWSLELHKKRLDYLTSQSEKK